MGRRPVGLERLLLADAQHANLYLQSIMPFHCSLIGESVRRAVGCFALLHLRSAQHHCQQCGVRALQHVCEFVSPPKAPPVPHAPLPPPLEPQDYSCNNSPYRFLVSSVPSSNGTTVTMQLVFNMGADMTSPCYTALLLNVTRVSVFARKCGKYEGSGKSVDHRA